MPAAHKRKAPEVRRQEILDAVVALAAERGLDSITVRDVARRVSVASGLIHHYFPSLDELLTESFAQWADASLEQLRVDSEGLPPRLALAMVVAYLQPEQRIWSDALTSASRYPRLRDRASELSEEYLVLVEGIIAAGVRDGVFACEQPRLAAWRLILMLDGLVAMVHILGVLEVSMIPLIVGPVVEDQLHLERDTFTELVQAVMRGLARPDGVRALAASPGADGRP